MQLENLKNQANKSIKKLTSILRQKKKINLFKILLIIFIPIFIILFILFYSNLANLFFYVKNKNTVKDETNILFKMAEEEYKKGFLENSAVYYQNYVNSNVSKSKKIIGYQRLFEINILKGSFLDALSVLDKIENLDKNILETNIDRIKIYIRLNEFSKAKAEISKNRNKLKNSIEFMELAGVFYLKTGEFDKALKELEKIPLKKREFNTHKKIIHCYLNLKKYNECIEYIKKIEKKYYLVGDDKIKSDLIILKEVAKIMSGKMDKTIEELKRASSLTSDNENIAIKLMLYSGMFLDSIDDVNEVTEKNENSFTDDINFIKLVGDYYIYKRNYQKALYYYEMLRSKSELAEDELMTFADLYYYTGDYNNSISIMKELFEKFNYKGANFYKNISIAYNKIGDIQNEIFFLKEGIFEYPKDTDFYVRLSKVYIDQKDAGMALQYINEAKKLYSKYSDMQYDKRIDALYIYILEKEKSNLDENELLNLREKQGDNPDNYFKIIKYYLENKKYSDAKRELNTVSSLPLEQYQKEILNLYKIILSINLDDKVQFVKSKKYLLENESNSDISKIDICIIHILDDDYDKALNILNNFDIYNLNDMSLKNKIIYLQAVCYLYKKNYPVAMKLIDILPAKFQASKRVIYLSSLIKAKYGESE